MRMQQCKQAKIAPVPKFLGQLLVQFYNSKVSIFFIHKFLPEVSNLRTEPDPGYVRPRTARVRFEINRWTVDILVTRGTGNFLFFPTPGTGKYEITAKIFRGQNLPTWSQRCRSAPSVPPTSLEHCTSAVCHHIKQHHAYAWRLCVLWAACTGFAGLLARQ
jgi:hypothetical protein